MNKNINPFYKDNFNPFKLVHSYNYQLSNYKFNIIKEEPYTNTIGYTEYSGPNDTDIIDNYELLEDFNNYGEDITNLFKKIDLNPLLLYAKKEWIHFESFIDAEYYTNLNFNNIIYAEKNLDSFVFAGNIINTSKLEKIINILISMFKKYGFPFEPFEVGEYPEFYTYVTLSSLIPLVHKLVIFHFLYSFYISYISINLEKLNSFEDPFDKEEYFKNVFIKDVKKINDLFEILSKDNLKQLIVDTEDFSRKDFIKTIEDMYNIFIDKVRYYSHLFSKDKGYNIVPYIKDGTLYYSSDVLFDLVWHTFVHSIISNVSISKICYCEICKAVIIQTGSKKPTRCSKHKNEGRQKRTDNKKILQMKKILQLSRNIKNIEDISLLNYIKKIEIILKKPISIKLRKISSKNLKIVLNKLNNIIKDNNINK